MFSAVDSNTQKIITVYGVRGDDYNNTLFLIYGPAGWEWVDADNYTPWRGPGA